MNAETGPCRAEEARRDDLARQPRDPREARSRSRRSRCCARRGRRGRLAPPAPRRAGVEALKAAIVRAPRGLARAALSPWPTSITEEADPARRARAAGESPLHLGDQDLLPPPRGGGRRAATPRPPRAEHRTLVSTIDKAVKRGALHRNTGARKKSRAAPLVRRRRRRSSGSRADRA